jgi:hypothetical protein
MAAANNARQGTLTPAWKTSVRVALATGATIATLIGTQVLVLADNASGSANTANRAANTDINSGPVFVPVDNSNNSSQDTTATDTNTDGRRQRYSYVNPAPGQPAPFTRSSRRG